MGLAFAPDGSRLVAYDGSVLRLWDTASGQEVFSLPGHNAIYGRLFFSRDGRRVALASRDADVTVRVFTAPGTGTR
jgi:WD40 repeat protein